MSEVTRLRADNDKLCATLEAARGQGRSEAEMKFLDALDDTVKNMNFYTRIKPSASRGHQTRIHSEGTSGALEVSLGSEVNLSRTQSNTALKSIEDQLSTLHNRQVLIESELDKRRSQGCGCVVM